MAFGDALRPVGEDHGDVERVAGAPDSAFAIDEALEALLDGLSAHVEAAHGLFVTVGEAQVADGLALAGEEDERLVSHLNLGEAVTAGLGRGDALELEVIDLQVHAGGGFRAAQVRGGGPEGVSAGVLGEKAQVGREEVNHRETVGLHVESGLLGIVPVLPVVLVPVHVIVPPIAVLDIPDGVFFLGRSATGDGQHLRRGLSSIQGILLAE